MSLARLLLPLCVGLFWLIPQTSLAAPDGLSLLGTGLSVPEASWEAPTLGFHRPFHRSYSSRRPWRTGGRPTPGKRFALEVALGIVGGAVGGAAGFFGASVLSPCRDATRFCDNVVLSTNGSAALGIVLGVFAGGELYEGEAHILGPVFGAGLGFVLGYVLAYPFAKGVALITCPPLMLLGALLGYEVTAKGPTAFRLQPLMGLDPHGARVGVIGSF